MAPVKAFAMQSIEPRATRLSPRLQAVADMIPPCRRLLDIGTDHAWLPIEMIRQARCQRAVAIDIRTGPLEIAARNIRAASLAACIETRLADGLGQHDLQADDAVVIAGLGGYEMMRVLGEEPRLCRALVLQPMKSMPELRVWLCRHGYLIEDESLVVEEHHTYVILRCSYSGRTASLNPLEAHAGPVLLQKKPDGYTVYLQRLLTKLKKQSIGDPDIYELIAQIQQLIREG